MPDLECGFSGIDRHPADALVYYGPTTYVDIGFDFAWYLGSPTPPVAGIQQVAALVDTGAIESCIDSQLARQLNLPVADSQKISGAGGVHETNMYLAQIYFPQLPFTLYGEFAGVELVAGGQQHQALIGRTFLRKFCMVYDGTTGRVTISPSQILDAGTRPLADV